MTTPRDLDESRVLEVIKGYSAAYEARDVQAMLAFFAEDADVTAGPGTFHGKEAVKQFLTWDVGLSPTVKIRAVGAGTVVSRNVAVSERVIEATYEGIQYEHPIVTVYELDHDAKIQHMRAYYDKLAIDQQVASRTPGVRGWFAKRMVNYLVAQGEKGLRH